MRRYKPILLASLLALSAAATAAAVDLTPEERTELRARAERLEMQRGQLRRVSDSIPIDRSRGDVRLDRDRGDVKADQQTSDVKPQKKRSVKAKTKERKKKRARRSLRDLPGALVRDR